LFRASVLFAHPGIKTCFLQIWFVNASYTSSTVNPMLLQLTAQHHGALAVSKQRKRENMLSSKGLGALRKAFPSPKRWTDILHFKHSEHHASADRTAAWCTGGQ
jgi:hypothetical protein